MRILLFFSLIIFLSNCASVEIAKEVTKATRSIKTSVTNIIKNSSNDNIEELAKNKKDDKKIINYEIANLEKEKKEKEKIIIEQKKVSKINFLGKNLNEVKLIIGEPNFLRTDGNSRTIRFDNNFCQLFLFSNAKIKNFKIEYYEIRNKNGELIINKEEIKKCYKNFNFIN